MDADGARDFVRQHRRIVLGTIRRDGRAQLSPVIAAVGDDGRIEISTREATAKARNLRRDPRATLCALTDAFFGPWVQIEGTAEILSLPDAMEPLVAYYRRLSGEHEDWDDYRRAMEEQRRCLLRITITRAVGD